MKSFKFLDKFKSTQVHALDNNNSTKLQKSKFSNFVSVSQSFFGCGIPKSNFLEPVIDPYLKPISYVESLADLYRRVESRVECNDKLLLCIEKYSLLCCLNDSKIQRKCLCDALKFCNDVYSKVVISAWLRFESREDDEFLGTGLVSKCDFNLSDDNYRCENDCVEVIDSFDDGDEDVDDCVSFSINDELVCCSRFKIAALSSPLKVMLYGSFIESGRCNVDFSKDGISVEAMRAVDVYSRSKRVDKFSVEVVLELLSFANRYCCEEMKSACDSYLASLVCEVDNALILLDYGLEEKANLLLASCLQVLLRELPSLLYNRKVMKVFCSSGARERWDMLGHALFLLYYFLSHVALGENMMSNITVMLLEVLHELATEKWQKALAMHQLGCVHLERKEYNDAQFCFEQAYKAGHVYSVTGIARAKYKLGQQYSAFRLVNSVIFEYKPLGWMYQERSLYCVGREKIVDLNTATELDPTLLFPYKCRAVMMMEEKQSKQALSEIGKILAFKLSADCLELRAWIFLALDYYESALTDLRALLTLEPNYMMFNGKVSADHLVQLLSHRVQQSSLADCWMQLYEQWSCVNDIGSLAVIHQMLANDPGNSLLRFRQSLLLLRLNCQKAAIRCLRLARMYCSSENEKLVYEGWILYDTGFREEALSRAEKSISMQRSFEAFFLKAYILADTNMDTKTSSHVVQLLEEALRCPSDALRKGQALNNLGSIYVDCGELDKAADCYMNALKIKHTRAHQGLARVYHLRNQRKAAFDEMTNLIEKAQNNASAYEKRSEYCDREMAKNDLDMATQLNPLRTYPYRYRAAVLMDDQKENEALDELSKAISFKPELQILHLRAAFYESIGEFTSALRDCEAALCLNPNHSDTIELYIKTKNRGVHL